MEILPNLKLTVQEVIEDNEYVNQNHELLSKEISTMEKKFTKMIKDHRNIYEEERSSYKNSEEINLKGENTRSFIETSLKKVEKNKLKIEAELEVLKENLKKNEEKLQNLNESIEELKQLPKNILPKIDKVYKMLVSTFAMQFDDTVNANQVKGFIIDPSSENVTPFQFDAETNSQYFITNCLWQQLGKPEAFLT